MRVNIVAFDCAAIQSVSWKFSFGLITSFTKLELNPRMNPPSDEVDGEVVCVS